MRDKESVWFDGRIIPAEDATVSVLSPTAQFGINVFEGIRAYWNKDASLVCGFRVEDHLNRLRRSSTLVGLDLHYSNDYMIAIMREVVEANGLQEDALLRLVWMVAGEGTWHSSGPTKLLIRHMKRPRLTPHRWRGLSAQVSSWNRIEESSLPPRVKAGANYLNSRYAYLAAKRDGYDVPLLRNSYGHLTESSGACVMLVCGDTLLTPKTTDSILEGITRDTVLTLAPEVGLKPAERTVDRTELYTADEVFLCGTTAEITPIVSVDRLNVGAAQPGPFTQAIATRYLSLASGCDGNQNGWLTNLGKSQ